MRVFRTNTGTTVYVCSDCGKEFFTKLGMETHTTFKKGFNEMYRKIEEISKELQEEELREKIAQEIENAVIEVVGDSAATMQQAARIARGTK
jgi:DNA-directed RNA polymerase subunit RPC12/RpoP